MISPKYHIHLTGDFNFSTGFHRSPAVISTADRHIFRGTYSGAYIRRPFLLVCACDELQNLSLYQQKIDIIFKNDCFKSQSQLYFALNLSKSDLIYFYLIAIDIFT